MPKPTEHQPGSAFAHYQKLLATPAIVRKSQQNESDSDGRGTSWTAGAMDAKRFFMDPKCKPSYFEHALTFTADPQMNGALLKAGHTLEHMEPHALAMAAANTLAIFLSGHQKLDQTLRRNEWGEKVHETGILDALIDNAKNPSVAWQTRGFSTVAAVHAGTVCDPAREKVENFLLETIRESHAKGDNITQAEMELSKSAMSYAEINPYHSQEFRGELRKIASSLPRAHWKVFALKGHQAELARHAKAMVTLAEGGAKAAGVKNAVRHPQERGRK